ncbi:MAG: cob(I)yrinic acid a,c-diamide adenosyltransferase [Candidatus Anstonellaceae archaeon]
MNKSYTRKGDEGYTDTGDGKRILKNERLMDAIGTIDELSSFIGITKNYIKEKTELSKIQKNLFEIGAVLSNYLKKEEAKKFEEETTELEKVIDRIDQELPELKKFIYPGGGLGASYLHVCRTVCRRAERKIVKLQQEEYKPIVKYINRLSSYFFALARLENIREGIEEEQWD